MIPVVNTVTINLKSAVESWCSAQAIITSYFPKMLTILHRVCLRFLKNNL